MGYIYQITNIVNGKKYIGLTTKTVEQRWNKHFKDAITAKRPHAIHLAIRKYGKNNFKISILAKINNFKELNKKESYFIIKYNTLSPNGYNLNAGGDARTISEETRLKMSKAQIGKKQSLDSRKKKSEKLIGKPQPGWVVKQRALALRKPVKEMIFGRIFVSVKAAAKKLNIRAKGISKNLHGKSNHYFGYVFVFIGK